MKILEICLFSAGIDGVFTRVKEESARLAKKGYHVNIFSSNLIKGDNKIAPEQEKMGKVTIRRFNVKKIPFSESYMLFNKNIEKAILNYNPDIIIAHSYRHNHTKITSRIAKKIGARCFLVTHAPFVTDENRSILAKWYIRLFYDSFIGKRILKKFDKIIAISKWEIPYLLKLGVPEDKIEYIPNGIPDEFFTRKRFKEENKILFLGRVSPIKDLITLINAISIIKDKSIKLEIVGPAEKEYLQNLKELIKEKNLEKRIIFSSAIYDINKKIAKIDSAKIFVLPSKREAMPQSLIEAMARGKTVISSDNLGAKDLIIHGKTGYLFKVGDYSDLSKSIKYALSKKSTGNEARKSVEKFKWSKIISILDLLIKNSR